MGKRKDPESEVLVATKTRRASLSEESSSDDDADMLDVEFEWFDPQPAYDFHGIKTLLRQLFDVDSQLFDLSALSDLVLAQPLLGSTVKVDGNETDPYAFLSILNLHEHNGKAAIAGLMDYLRARCEEIPSLDYVKRILAHQGESQVGLVLTERLINVPSEVAPPMYKMLQEEIAWALEEQEPYSFSHYLIWSKVYREVQSVLDDDEDDAGRDLKRLKTKNKKSNDQIFYFHPEDEILQKYAICSGTFQYKSEGVQSDSKRTFSELGVKPEGHLVMIEAARFAEAVTAIQQYFGQA